MSTKLDLNRKRFLLKENLSEIKILLKSVHSEIPNMLATMEEVIDAGEELELDLEKNDEKK